MNAKPVLWGWGMALASVLAMPAVGWTKSEPADASAPIEVQAQSLRYDELRGLSVFSGDVLFSRGNLRIQAERIEIQQSKDGQQKATAWGAEGALVKFRQKRPAANEQVEGQAEKIEYDSRNDVAVLTQQALIRRTQGERVLDEVSGALIQYDARTSTFVANGALARSAPSSVSGGRVRVTLVPRSAAASGPQESEPKDSATQNPGPGLRATPQLKPPSP